MCTSTVWRWWMVSLFMCRSYAGDEIQGEVVLSHMQRQEWLISTACKEKLVLVIPFVLSSSINCYPCCDQSVLLFQQHVVFRQLFFLMWFLLTRYVNNCEFTSFVCVDKSFQCCNSQIQVVSIICKMFQTSSASFYVVEIVKYSNFILCTQILCTDELVVRTSLVFRSLKLFDLYLLFIFWVG